MHLASHRQNLRTETSRTPKKTNNAAPEWSTPATSMITSSVVVDGQCVHAMHEHEHARTKAR